MQNFIRSHFFREPAFNPDKVAPPGAEWFSFNKFKFFCYGSIISKFRMGIKRKMAGIKGNIVFHEEFYPLVVNSCQWLAYPPQQPMVDKNHVSTRFFCPFKSLHRSVNRKGYLFYRSTVVINLQSILGRVTGKIFNIQYLLKIFIQLFCRKIHLSPLLLMFVAGLFFLQYCIKKHPDFLAYKLSPFTFFIPHCACKS